MQKQLTPNSLITLEGHLRLQVILDKDNRVSSVAASNVSFKDTALLLRGKDKREAPKFAMRLFGVGAGNHYQRSLEAIESALELQVPSLAKDLRSLINGFYYIYDHISHFYHLHGFDWIDIEKALSVCEDEELKRAIQGQIHQGNFKTQSKISDLSLAPAENFEFIINYFKALKLQGEIIQTLNKLGCKFLFPSSFVLGGCLKPVVLESDIGKKHIENMIEKINVFINYSYKNDLLLILKNYKLTQKNLGVGVKNFFSAGDFLDENSDLLFPKGRAKLDEKLHFFELENDEVEKVFTREKREDEAFEVGPLARGIVALSLGDNTYQKELEEFLRAYEISYEKLFSFLGRHITRFIEAQILCTYMGKKLDSVTEGLSSLGEDLICKEEKSSKAKSRTGFSLCESSRGSIGHFVRLNEEKVENYFAVVPSNLNTGVGGKLGVYEQSLLGITLNDPHSPNEILEVIHSFNQCVCCNLIIQDEKGKVFGMHKVETSCSI